MPVEIKMFYDSIGCRNLEQETIKQHFKDQCTKTEFDMNQVEETIHKVYIRLFTGNFLIDLWDFYVFMFSSIISCFSYIFQKIRKYQLYLLHTFIY